MIFRSEFTVGSWKETELEGENESRLMRVSARFLLTGDIKGDLLVEYLMHYLKRDEQDLHDSLAWYTGFVAFTGELAGKAGGFTMLDTGTYTKSGPQSKLAIIAPSASGELAGISGQGRYFAEGEKMVLELDCAF